MSVLTYTLVIEETEDPEYFTCFSPDLEGYTGAGATIGECVDAAVEGGFEEYVQFMREMGKVAPSPNPEAKLEFLRYEPPNPVLTRHRKSHTGAGLRP